MKLKDIAVGKVVQVGNAKFVKVAGDQYLALDLCPTGSTYSSFYKGCVVKTTDFAYTGGEQTFTTPADGYYVLEVWGAQGGTQNNKYIGGYGGYSIGITKLSLKNMLYLYVGGQGQHCTSGICLGGYNGGGQVEVRNSYHSSGGGGATHMSLDYGELVAQVQHVTDNRLIIVAGAGGGSFYYTSSKYSYGGHGGGYMGNTGVGVSYATGGDQYEGGIRNDSYASNGEFGKGGNSQYASGGGGSGYYGGGGGHDGGAGGGSGYIGSENLLSLTNFPKHMTCYNCTTSTDPNTYTISNTCASEEPTADCAKIGNGAARITQLSVYLGI